MTSLLASYFYMQLSLPPCCSLLMSFYIYDCAGPKQMGREMRTLNSEPLSHYFFSDIVHSPRK
jgi:hypothetical protein